MYAPLTTCARNLSSVGPARGEVGRRVQRDELEWAGPVLARRERAPRRPGDDVVDQHLGDIQSRRLGPILDLISAQFFGVLRLGQPENLGLELVHRRDEVIGDRCAKRGDEPRSDSGAGGVGDSAETHERVVEPGVRPWRRAAADSSARRRRSSDDVFVMIAAKSSMVSAAAPDARKMIETESSAWLCTGLTRARSSVSAPRRKRREHVVKRIRVQAAARSRADG